MSRIELRDARTRQATGTIPLSVLDDMGITIPEDGGTYWFSKEQADAIKRHPEWESFNTCSACHQPIDTPGHCRECADTEVASR